MGWLRGLLAGSLLIAIFAAGCSGEKRGEAVVSNISASEPGDRQDPDTTPRPQAGAFGLALPVDAVQPWEELDANGKIVPPGSPRLRNLSAISSDEHFVPGVERFLGSSAAEDLGEATRLPGAEGGVNFAVYRFPMGGEQPGTFSAFVNPRPALNDSPSEYWIGLSDYRDNNWRWFGPYSESLTRESFPAGDFTSDLGNCYMVLLAYDGAQIDVVGAGISPLDEDDVFGPPAPGKPQLRSLAGAVLVDWVPVIDAGIAGYRVYYNNAFFADHNSLGISRIGYISADTRLLIPTSELLFVRVTAVDVSGNESTSSEISSAGPLGGLLQELSVEVDPVSVLKDGLIELAASGAQFYDYDLDGDGIFDAAGDEEGAAVVDTSQPGLLRPVVRGRGQNGREMFRTLNVIVTGSSRPVAVADANPSSGQVPLAVQFTGQATDDDGEIELYQWDFDADGNYDYTSTFNPNPAPHVYGLAGLYNVKFRVEDDSGSFDVDTVGVLVESGVIGSAPSEWSMFGKDRRGTRRSDFAGTQTDQFQWNFEAGGVIRGSAAIGRNGMIVFGCADGKVYAVNALGVQLWFFTTGDAVLSSPAIAADGTVYIGSDDGFLYALNEQGGLRWKFDAGTPVQSSPAVGPDGSIFFGSTQGKLFRLSSSGGKIWEFSSGGSIVAAPIVGDNGTIYFGSFDNAIYAVLPQGAEDWRFATGGAIRSSPALSSNGAIYATSADGNLYSISQSGDMNWFFETGGGIDASPAVGEDGTIYVSSGDDCLYAVSPAGDEEWRFNTKGGGFSSPSISADGIIYIGSGDAQVYAIRPNGTKLWSYATQNIVNSSPAIARTGLIYIGSRDTRLYAIGTPVESEEPEV